MTWLTDTEARDIRRRWLDGEPLDAIRAAYPHLHERQVEEAGAGHRVGISTAPEDMAARPGCMDEQEFARWQVFNRTQNYRHQLGSPCGDCLPDFALEVRAAPINLCDGRPGGVEEDTPMEDPVAVLAA